MDLQMKPFTAISTQSKRPSNQVDMKERLEIVIKAYAVDCELATFNFNRNNTFLERFWNFFCFRRLHYSRC